MTERLLLEINDLCFCYPGGSRASAFHIPKFGIEKGKKVFLYGPSGSGKSTFLELLAGILVPQSGSIVISETDLVKLTSSQRDRFRRQYLGFIFQNFNLLPYLTAYENIVLPLNLKGGMNPEDQIRVQNLIRDLDLQNVIEKPVSFLSVGQQQRVAAARAFCMSPQLLLADEPTSALDAESRGRFLETLFKVAKSAQTTVIFVSHDRSLEPLFDEALSIETVFHRSISNPEVER